MKAKSIMTLLVFVASLFSAAAVFAAQQGVTTGQQEKVRTGQTQQSDRNLYSASWLIGNKVVNPLGQDLGEISNIIMDQQSGKAAFVVVASGGFLNFGEEHHMVPYNALKIQGNQIVVDIDKQKLSKSPKMQEGLTVKEFDRRSSEFFGVSPLFQ